MAYFLKQSHYKKGTYLQIYESFYHPERKNSAHKCYKTLGYLDDLIAAGIDDPVAYYKKEVEALNIAFNKNKQQKQVKQISDDTPEKALGYFPLSAIQNQLKIKPFLDLMQSVTNYDFNVYDMLSALIYARVIEPCSKRRTFEHVIPKLFNAYDFSLNQLYDGLEYIGLEYEKIIEIYNHQIAHVFGTDTTHTYFDCTNFYFEIDREDAFRKNGPSKENRHCPLVGLALLLDANQIPIGMKLYPGNESEKPKIKNLIDDLKLRNNINGRTVRVADKGLNCADNIAHAKADGDGYIFSKSVKLLPETERTWVLLEQDYQDVKSDDGTLLYRYKDCVDDFPYTVNINGKKRTVHLKEKRLVTYNPKLAEKQIREINKQVTKAKALTAARAKRSEYGDSAKYVKFLSTDDNGVVNDNTVKVMLNQKAVEKARALAGYNLIVTSETEMPAKDIYAAYHNLWRIEESFKIMKSQLDARPVFLQNKERIIGHFLVCYLVVLLTRILQFKVLDNIHCPEAIMQFMKSFRVVKFSENKYINITKNSAFIKALKDKTGLPITNYYLKKSDIKKVLSHNF